MKISERLVILHIRQFNTGAECEDVTKSLVNLLVSEQATRKSLLFFMTTFLQNEPNNHPYLVRFHKRAKPANSFSAHLYPFLESKGTVFFGMCGVSTNNIRFGVVMNACDGVFFGALCSSGGIRKIGDCYLTTNSVNVQLKKTLMFKRRNMAIKFSILLIYNTT